MAFGVANNCFVSGGSCLSLEVGLPGRVGTVKWCGEGCLPVEVVSFETADVLRVLNQIGILLKVE